MGPQKKKKKFSPAYENLPRDSPDYNSKFENRYSNFRGGCRGQGTSLGNKRYRGKNPRTFYQPSANEGNQKRVAIGAANSLAMPEKRVIGEQAKEVVTTPKKAILNPALKMLPPLNSPSLSLLPNTENLQVGGSLYRFRDK